MTKGLKSLLHLFAKQVNVAESQDRRREDRSEGTDVAKSSLSLERGSKLITSSLFGVSERSYLKHSLIWMLGMVIDITLGDLVVLLS